MTDGVISFSFIHGMKSEEIAHMTKVAVGHMHVRAFLSFLRFSLSLCVARFVVVIISTLHISSHHR
jgi:hypothetical protein